MQVVLGNRTMCLLIGIILNVLRSGQLKTLRVYLFQDMRIYFGKNEIGNIALPYLIQGLKSFCNLMDYEKHLLFIFSLFHSHCVGGNFMRQGE